MNKNEFVNKINIKSGISKKECELCLNTIIEVIKDALKNGDSITISNFGKFTTANIKQKSIYNFKTGSSQIIEQIKTAKFKPSENLKQVIK